MGRLTNAGMTVAAMVVARSCRQRKRASANPCALVTHPTMETETEPNTTRKARPWLVHCDRRLLTAPISHGALRLWLLIDACTGTDGTAYPGNELLGEQLQVDGRTVRRFLAELSAAGLVTVELLRTADGTERTLVVQDETAWCTARNLTFFPVRGGGCLLYTSDAADE